MTGAVTFIRTADGTVIARDLATGITASGRAVAEACADLRRLLAARQAPAHTHARETVVAA